MAKIALMRSWGAVLIAAALGSLGLAAPSASADDETPEISGTFVQGPCLETGPHSYDMSTGAFECVGVATWSGTFDGSGLFRARGWVHPVTGDASGEAFVRIPNTNGEYEVDLVGPFEVDGTTGKQTSHLSIVRATGTMHGATGMVMAEGTAVLTGIEASGGYSGSWASRPASAA